MFKHIKNLIQKIKDKIDELHTIDIEEVLCSIDGGDMKKRAGYVIAGCRDTMPRRDAAVALGPAPRQIHRLNPAPRRPWSCPDVRPASQRGTNTHLAWA